MSLEIVKICRTCLALDGGLMSIYDSKGSTGSGCVADMIGDLTTKAPKKFDGMPEKVCLACISEINRCFSFKMKCENSDRTLRQLLEISEDKLQDSVETKETIVLDTRLKPPEEKKKLQKRKANNSMKIILEEQDVESQEELEASYFVIGTIEDENENEDAEGKHETEDNANSIDFEEILEKFVAEPQSDEVAGPQSDEVADPQSNELAHPQSDEVADPQSEELADQQSEELADPHFEELAHPQCEEVKESSEYKPSPRHLSSQKKIEQKCLHCAMSFVHPRNLTKHMRKHHKITTVDPQTVATIKPDHFEQQENKEDVKFQVEFHQMEEADVKSDDKPQTLKAEAETMIMLDQRCPDCGAGFAQHKSLSIHIRRGKCTKKQYVCPECQKVFISAENLREHIRTHSEKIPCEECHNIFRDKHELAEHKLEMHKMRNQCPTCNKVFAMLSTLRDHMRIHSGERPFLCPVCGKGFTQNANLKQHLMRHNNTKPFKCDQCSRSFVTKGELFSHVRSHNGDHPFFCDTCEAKFTTSSSLLKHRRIHTGERPYACDFCPMRFNALNTLKNHRRTHTGEKPYKCKFCVRGFAQKSDCTSHMRTHTGDRRYVCQVCGFAFYQSGTLRTHMKIHRVWEIPAEQEEEPIEEQKEECDAEMTEEELVQYDIEECSIDNDFNGE